MSVIYHFDPKLMFRIYVVLCHSYKILYKGQKQDPRSLRGGMSYEQNTTFAGINVLVLSHFNPLRNNWNFVG